MKLAVIPARGGSKRIPRKNIRQFCGKPMIAWSIEIAQRSGLFDRIIVSTDDTEIAEIASEHGAEVPFLRPADISDDFTGTAEVVQHAIQNIQSKGHQVDDVCCIYATAPFARSEDIEKAYQELGNGWSYVIPACEFNAPIFRSFQRYDDGSIEMLYPDKFASRSQDLPEALHDAGQFYWGKAAAWLELKPFFTRDTYALRIPAWRVQDIDTNDDWRRAELMFVGLEALESKE
ncbi:pseudaminic acid cytidylyltransferase [Neptuniibacter sp. QD48_11]|uniref:pseudaminic acid cytidylyltransferase n=1 Tax=Neptuniibacter sp. QD48_11 TaxID=3398211 RepID=UPI0039F5C110